MKRYFAILMMIVVCVAGVPAMTYAVSAPDPVAQSKSNAKKGTSKKQPTKKATSKNSSKNKSASKGTAVPAKKKQTSQPSTSAEARRREQDARKEIQLTEEQIRENDSKVKKSLGELSRLGSDINTSKTKVAAISSEIGALDSSIKSLEGDMSANEKELKRLRDKYMDAVKKVRSRQRRNSDMAFVFSSDNLNQALRRMRYLRQFSDWRDSQSKELEQRTELLKKQTAQLSSTRRQKDTARQRQQKVQNELESQYARQDAIVADLRKNGEALRSHLSRKQAEADALSSRISQLIAQEQAKAKAEAEARARAEAEAAERERMEKERARKEAEALAKAEAAKAQALEAAEGTAAKPESNGEVKSSPEDKKASKKESDATPVSAEKKKDKSKKEHVGKSESNDSKDYASARRRKPRSDSKSADKGKNAEKEGKSSASGTAPAKSAAKPAAGGSFEKMKGQLPRPVSGAFKVTSPFGRHPYPGLPDVMYDNLGIDVEVASGAQVKSVYAGKVSAVFIMPDYQTVVMVNHGNYVTVYGHISAASVKSGDTVTQGQTLGTLAPDADDPGHSLLHFEVWKNREKQDPMQWIK